MYRLDLPPSLLIFSCYIFKSFVVISLVDDAVRLYTLCIHAGRRQSLILVSDLVILLSWRGWVARGHHGILATPGDGNGGQNSESPFKKPWRDAAVRQMDAYMDR